jgi:diguanylate cyclase (GGDEF)-like protein
VRELSKKNRGLKIKHREILLKYKESCKEKRKYEDSVKRIMQLYVTGRKLFQCVSKEEYAEIVLNFLKKMHGIAGCGIFEKIKFDWSALVCSGVLQNRDLIPYIDSLEFSRDRKYIIVDNEEFDSCNFKILCWPLKIKSGLLGCVVVVAETKYISRYIEEGSIFAPQISLGLERVNFFHEIYEKSRNDGLTGLYLKRYFLQRLDLEMQREKRYSSGFYILMLDLDYFKRVNDKYGHLIGDKVLAEVAGIILSVVKPGDLVARYGGEEFIILMPVINEKEVKIAAEKIKDSVQHIVFKENGDVFSVTVSIGISCNSRNISDPDFIINAADKALYRAKNRGRNQIVLYNEETHSSQFALF